MKYLKFLIVIIVLTLIKCDKENDKIIEDGINTESNRKVTGSSANDFLSSQNYQSLVVEVSYVDGFRPNNQSLLNLKQFLENRINKPVGINIIEKQITTPNKTNYSISDIINIEKTNRVNYNRQGILTVHLLFINGGFESDNNSNKILGSAYYNTSIVIFEKTIQEYSNEIFEPNRVDLETTVLLHEFCHLFGLVDLGSNMQNPHLDSDHGKHCENEECLMYWKVENTSILQMMSSGNIPQLDTNCLLDLHANGGK